MPAPRTTRDRWHPAHHVFLLVVVALAASGLAVHGQAPAPAAASAPAASLDEILKGLATYNGGIDSEAVWKLRDYVDARRNDPAERAACETALLQFLKSRATPVAKMAVCRHLRAIASDKAVPVLGAMLSDPLTADMALYALQPLPGDAADAALVRALPALAGPTKIAVISALGRRKTAGAVPALVPLLDQAPFAVHAAVALGAIGGDAAIQALVAAYPGTSPGLKPVVAASIMQCAERALAARRVADALRLYDTLLADASLAAPSRTAAALGRIAAAGSDAPGLLVSYLEGPDAVKREAAIARISGVIPPEGIGRVCDLLPGLPEPAQVKVLAALRGFPPDRVLPTILQAARTGPAAVRIAAMQALESAGGPSAVSFLAEAAAGARGAELTAARAALGALRGRAVDEAIVTLLAGTPAEGVERELLLAVADRRIFAAKSGVAASLASPSLRVRVQALKTLRVIGTPSDIPAVLDVLLATADETERTQAETTTAALAGMIAGADSRGGAIRARLTAEKEPAQRARIIGVLALVGDSSTLPALRRALDDDDADVYDAAVRALAAWPTSAAREDVLKLARDSRSETHRLLAIRGLVRLVGLDRYREPSAAVADLRSAAGFSWRREEQVLILGALVQFPCRDALDLATGFLREPSVKAEAEAAITKIKARLPKGGSG